MFYLFISDAVTIVTIVTAFFYTHFLILVMVKVTVTVTVTVVWAFILKRPCWLCVIHLYN